MRDYALIYLLFISKKFHIIIIKIVNFIILKLILKFMKHFYIIRQLTNKNIKVKLQ